MSLKGKLEIKSIAVSLVIILLLAMALTINAQNKDAKNENNISVFGKLLSIDPIKGDVTVRLEFEPHGSFVKEDGSLAKNIKFDTVSSNGKQEVTFEKGKRMSPTEVVLNMYDGDVTRYPIDHHKANLWFFFTVKPDKPADKPKPAEDRPEGEQKPAPVEEETEVEVSFVFAFDPIVPVMPGYTITTAKSKDSDDNFIDLEMSISRSPMVMLFSIFIILLMWGVSLAVLGLVFTVVILGRKVEIAMFSFIATLLFAFVQVRNSQPGVPPVGTFSDILSFFWAEGILGLCLLIILMTWIFRKPA